MRKASGRMGVVLKEPTYIELGDNRKATYISAINRDVDPQYHKIVVVLLPNAFDKHHIKFVLDNDIGVASQFVLSKTASKAAGALSVAGNILK